MSAALAPYRLGTVLLAAVLVSLGLSSRASAGFTSDTTATATVRAAADWTPPTVSLASPGGSIKDTVTLTVTATDAETGVRDVAIQHLPPGGTDWVTICSVSSAPYTCAWDTTTTLDGSHGLRARATDGTGLTSVSASLSTTVANTVRVVLGDPGAVVRGQVGLPVTLERPGQLSWSVRVEYAVAGSGTWTALCTGLVEPYACSWDTTALANQQYDLRAVATSGSTTHRSAVTAGVLVDNAAPSVTMADPGTPLRGTVTLAATAGDPHAGVAQVVIERAPTGTSAWADACAVTTAPYSCSFDTSTVADGPWSFRAVATDRAGNVAVSSVVANRAVDNTVSSVTMTDPGPYLAGPVTLAASASSTAGVTRVTVQRAPSGSGTWTDACSTTTGPWSCTWSTATVPDGLYDLRAVLVDGSGKVTTSAVVAARRIDNSPLQGLDVQAVNGGGAVVGELDAGDAITFTWSRRVSPGSVTAGWDGSPLDVSLRLRDGGLLGLGGKDDTVDVLRAGSAVNLGSVNLREEFVTNAKSASFAATMTAGSTTVGGVPRTTVTVTITGLESGVNLRAARTGQAMTWSPSASVLDELGRPSSTAPVTEPGALDKDF